MFELEDFDAAVIETHYINKIVEAYDVDQITARQLLLNSLSYNVVTSEIMNMISVLAEENKIVRK